MWFEGFPGEESAPEGERRESRLRNFAVVAVAMGISTVMAEMFFHFSKNSTSVAIIYVLGVMLVARYTTGYLPGLAASLLGVIFVNYVFTYPYMHFNFTIDGYPVTFAGMMLVSGITSTTMTTLKEQNRLIHAREKLVMAAEKETMRANLLRAVSHDLRTPLTSIIGMADTYLAGQESMKEEEKTRLVSGISEDANWLLNMVENLLSITRIRDGEGSTKVTTCPEPLEEVVSEAVQRLRRRLPGAQIQVRVPDEFLMIPMDAMLIEQVIINLLENAVYHSGVEERIDLYVEKKEKSVEFHIRDYGRGISKEQLPHIFDGIGSCINASSDAHKGMGIGLTICKTIITAHNGTIRAENRSQGAEFIFTLPLGEEEKHE